MKIQKIRLENFRVYYGEQEISFSTDDKKNVTLCLSKNNGGKTTLAQSIIWCLYGYLNLKEPDEILNKEVKLSMLDGESRTVAITLEILHKGKRYIIRREQAVRKTRTTFTKSESKQTIMKFSDAQIVPVNININDILPETLSRFFIFDGERMLHLGSNDQVHRDSLQKDIRNILGLEILEEAINHLGGRNKNRGVLLSLANQMSNENDSVLRQVQEEINHISQTISDLESQMSENSEQQKNRQSELANISEFLKGKENVKQNQLERDELNKQITLLNERKDRLKNTVMKKMSESLPLIVLHNLFNETISFAKESSDAGEAAPDVTLATIEYILDNKECLCGTQFKETDEIYTYLDNSKKIYPPESIGTTTKLYLDKVRLSAKMNEETIEQVEDLYTDYLQLDADIHNKKRKCESISRHIQESTEEAIKEAEKRYQILITEIEELKELNIEIRTLKKLKQDELDDNNLKLRELSEKTEINKRINRYIEMTNDVLELIKSTYKNEEKSVRLDLQNEVQKIYNTINRGNGKIQINDKFDFVLHTKINGQMIKDDTKGQGLSTVAAFSFVCGITKMVRDQMEDELISNEPYPLIIDAPYSVMDKDYIEKVSEILPKYAEQLIILVKDDNFEIARAIFEKDNVIGAEYRIELEKSSDGTENQFRTKILG